MPSAHAQASTFGPEDKREALAASPDATYDFIVRGRPHASDALLSEAARRGQASGSAPRPLPLIDGWAVRLTVRDALELSEREDALQVWYLHPDLAALYVNVIDGLRWGVETLPLPSAVNISLGPPASLTPMTQDASEPMHEATRRAAEAGLLPVMAIGNYRLADPQSRAVNPWCLPRWVICVGASDGEDGLYIGTAFGDAEDRETWPDVVANGVDVVGAWPSDKPKPASRKAADDANPIFLRQVAPEARDRFTIGSGTSFAAPEVSAAASQILHFVKSVAASRKDARFGTPLFSLMVPRARFTNADRMGPRLVGTVIAETPEALEVSYALVEPWKMVKQLLIDSAIPMPSFEGRQVGAGRVSRADINAQFGAFGVVSPKIAPIKVLEEGS